MKSLNKLIDKLACTHALSKEEWIQLIQGRDSEVSEYLFSLARRTREKYYGDDIYIRGLIEFTNYCKNDCLYCGIRRGNQNAVRYRLTLSQIMECCKMGYELGYRTFVLQGGEDAYFNDERMCEIIRSIKKEYPDCAVTLSLGERSEESYRVMHKAGADRYLLREETSVPEHYAMLHPKQMSLENRLHCLEILKETGYQTGCGFMVGSPGWQLEYLARELCYIKKLRPHMIGIGPFIPHKDTVFAKETGGSLDLTLNLVAMLRLMNPNAMIPATTAVGTIDPRGREKAILSGANVVMPNLSPVSVRKNYMLYDNKLCTGDEAAECRKCLDARIRSIGYEIVTDRGDYREF